VRTRTIGTLGTSLALALVLAACGSSSGGSSSSSSSSSGGGGGGSATASGAGSTFAAPVYQQWGSAIKGVTLNFQAVGSGAGITALTNKTVDFGATDPPMKDPEVAAAAKNGAVVHVPTFLGAITVSYNLPGAATGLKLDGKTIADIFLGKVKTWSDPEIASLNAGTTLPSTPITVIHRSDSSGTTSGFTGFLAGTSPTWKSKVGMGKDVPWPTGTGAKGNAGVAGAIQQTPGAVGYVEQAYALQHKFTYASVKNTAGQFVAPTLQSTSAAGMGLTVPADLRFTVSKPSSPAAYPIVSQTFVVVYKDMCKAGVPGGQAAAKGVAKFLSYGLGQGQQVLSQADYAALPPSILDKAKMAVSSLQCNGAPLTP